MLAKRPARIMNFKQYYLGCLSHASYYIGSEGEAAVVDPQRDIDQYAAEAEAQGQKIKYVIETHLHADFVSGHIELAQKTGAAIVIAEKANAEFPHLPVKEGEELHIGNLKLKILETPGHTPEGISILISDDSNPEQPAKLLTGDTLFIGDVGRPDLAGGVGFTPKQMAGMMHDTLHNKILKLSDETEIYPAHGAGSLCGKNMSKETWSTLGEQKLTNYALRPMPRDEFVSMMTAETPEMPAYFPASAMRNRKGARQLSEISRPAAMTAAQILEFQGGGIVLDVRGANEYGAGHIPNALNIGLGGQFACWSGTLIPLDTRIVVAAESEEKVEEAVMRLARVGIESVEGFVCMSEPGAVATGLSRQLATTKQISVVQMSEILKSEKPQFIDVRRKSEYEGGHALNAVNLTLSQLENLALEIDPSLPTYVICQGGYRSSAATSILERKGFKSIHNVTGGTSAWIKAGLAVDKKTGATSPTPSPRLL